MLDSYENDKQEMVELSDGKDEAFGSFQPQKSVCSKARSNQNKPGNGVTCYFAPGTSTYQIYIDGQKLSPDRISRAPTSDARYNSQPCMNTDKFSRWKWKADQQEYCRLNDWMAPVEFKFEGTDATILSVRTFGTSGDPYRHSINGRDSPKRKRENDR